MAAGRTLPPGRRLKCVWFTSLRCETAKFRRKLSSIWGAPCNCCNQAITPIEEWYRLEFRVPSRLQEVAGIRFVGYVTATPSGDGGGSARRSSWHLSH